MLAVSSTLIDNLMRKKLIIGSVVAALGVIASRCQRRDDPGFLDCFQLRKLAVAMTRKL